MTLYEINEKMLSLVDDETGELLDFEAFSELAMARDEKLENTCKWIKDLNAEADAIAAEIKALQERKKAKENKAERLKSYLAQALDGETFECPAARVSYRKSTALAWESVTAAAHWLEDNGFPDLVTYPEAKLDGNEVKKLLKAGELIPGVSLEERKSVVIK